MIGQGDYFAIELSAWAWMLADDIGYDSRDKYAVIASSRCVNPDTAAAVLGSVIEQLSGPVPDSAFAAQIAEAKAQAADGAGDAGAGGMVRRLRKLPRRKAQSPRRVDSRAGRKCLRDRKRRSPPANTEHGRSYFCKFSAVLARGGGLWYIDG